MNLWTETPHRDASGAVKIALAKCSMLCHHGRIQPEALACKRLWLVATSLRSARLASHASTPATLLLQMQTTVPRQPGCRPSWQKLYGYNPTKAKALLNQAGYP